MEIVNYDTLLEKNAAIGFDKQFSLAEFVGDRNWQFDAEKGTIIFGNDIEMAVQILGSYSFQSQTWLWVWANEQIDYPAEILTNANELKAMGEQYNIEFLTKPQYHIEPTDVHALGMIASGEFAASAYYAGDYGDGIALFLLYNEQLDKIEYNEHVRILTAFSQMIEIFSMNHRRTLISYLKQKKYELSEAGDKLTATKKGNKIVATFDAQQRLINIIG